MLQEAPILSDRIISRLYESYDRTGMNKDGCDGTNCTDSILHGRVNNPLGTTDGTYEYILFSTEIPTVIKRFWLTDFPAGTLLRFYFDGKNFLPSHGNLMALPLHGMMYEETAYFRTYYRYFISDPIYYKKISTLQ